VPGWQIIGSFYAGHDSLSNGAPLAQTYDNSLSFFTRYDWSKESPLHGLAVAAGVTRQGGRFASTGSYTGAGFPAFTQWSGLVKLHAGTPAQAFVNYTATKHWAFKLSCLNILNEYYAEGYSGLIQGEEGLPRTFQFEVDWKN